MQWLVPNSTVLIEIALIKIVLITRSHCAAFLKATLLAVCGERLQSPQAMARGACGSTIAGFVSQEKEGSCGVKVLTCRIKVKLIHTLYCEARVVDV